MKKIVIIIGFTILGLLAIAILSFVGLYFNTQARLSKTYNLPTEMISIPTDPSSISKGKHLFTIHCAVCHGIDLAGTVVFQDPKLGTITAPDISSGKGEGGTVLSDTDFIHAIRHGVGPDNKALLVMPSGSFYHFNDEDLRDIIAFVRNTPTIDKQLPETRLTPLGAALVSANAFGKIIDAEEIDHTGVRPLVVEPGITAAYGDYLVKTGECRVCHGPNLSGGSDPNPDAPPAPNLTRTGPLSGWSQEGFMNTLRTGITPDEYHLSDFMPWRYMGQMTDDELKAVWLYLQSQK